MPRPAPQDPEGSEGTGADTPDLDAENETYLAQRIKIDARSPRVGDLEANNEPYLGQSIKIREPRRIVGCPFAILMRSARYASSTASRSRRQRGSEGGARDLDAGSAARAVQRIKI